MIILIVCKTTKQVLINNFRNVSHPLYFSFQTFYSVLTFIYPSHWTYNTQVLLQAVFNLLLDCRSYRRNPLSSSLRRIRKKIKNTDKHVLLDKHDKSQIYVKKNTFPSRRVWIAGKFQYWKTNHTEYNICEYIYIAPFKY